MPNRPKVGEILIRAGVIDEFQLRAALGEQARWGQPIGATLVKLGFVEERDLVRALASQLELPVATLEGKRIHKKVLDLVPAKLAERHMVMPLFVKKEGAAQFLYLGVEDPGNLEAFDDLTFRTGMTVKPVMVSPSELCEAIDRYYTRGAVDAAPEAEPSPVDELELELDEESTAPVIDTGDTVVAAEAPAPNAGAPASGTEELARHWKIDAEEPLELDDETLSDSSSLELDEPRSPADAVAAPLPQPSAPVVPEVPATPEPAEVSASDAAPLAPSAEAEPIAAPAEDVPLEPLPEAIPAVTPAEAAQPVVTAEAVPAEPPPEATPLATPLEAEPTVAAVVETAASEPDPNVPAAEPLASAEAPETIDSSEPEPQELASEDLQVDTSPDAFAVKNRQILHTLTQLLIEKGVISQEELRAKFRELHSSDAGSD